MDPSASAHIKPRDISYSTLRHLLVKRSGDSHKGDFGHVLVVGGDHGFGGAVLLAAEAAARSGAGLVSVATRAGHVPACLARRPEIMAHAVATASELEALLAAASVIVAGPGLGQGDWSRQCLQSVFEAARQRDLPLVADADALNLISQGFSEKLFRLPDKWILTPHPGEAARLLGRTQHEIQQNRPQACMDLQARFGGVAILKGAGSLITWQQHGRLQLERCRHGNPGMSSGGMGDVLSGMLGGLLAQKFSLADSARLGTCIHSHSADILAAREGERGLLASDLFPIIRSLVNN